MSCVPARAPKFVLAAVLTGLALTVPVRSATAQPPAPADPTQSVAAAESAAAGSQAEPTGESVSRAEIDFYESRIRPLLVDHCYACHGPDKQESDLRLDTPARLLGGGKSGAAIVPGQPAASLLLTAVGYQDASLQMPPDGRLTETQIADLRRWIELGAPAPTDTASPSTPGRTTSPRTIDIERGRQLWAFQPPRQRPLPTVSDTHWPQTPIDYFILAKLDTAGLKPAERADKLTLIRRATFDLTGLPPERAAIEAFLADTAPDAYTRLIDRLLNSPHYGEHWGRHWLDVARYADSNGLDENIAHGNAWRYRDWVIASFNGDLPYDEFVRLQLAGDLLQAAEPSERHRQLIATGFLALGPKVLAEVDETKMEMDIVDEQIDAVGRAVLGLTLGCARCHDHKFDPITQADYYALAGIFKSTRTMDSFTKIAKWHENEIASAAELAAREAHLRRIEGAKSIVNDLVSRSNAQLQAELGAGAALPADPESKYPEPVRDELKRLRAEVAQLEQSTPELPSAMGVTEGTPVDVAIHVRGSHLTLGEVVSRRFPAVLSAAGQSLPAATGSGRRELVEWLTRPEHPLTARVVVNRVWRWHFGRGLVGTPDNFGALGEQPTHPELLDWLAVEFPRRGWSIKELHRLIMLSATYQMTSAAEPAVLQADPDNRLYARAPIQRLSAESVRDAILAVSRRLDGRLGGSLLHVKNREFLFDHTSKDNTRYDVNCRSVYLPVVRNHLYDVFQLFDYADAGVVEGNRPTSTVATQALFLLNSDLVIDSADALAGQMIGAAVAPASDSTDDQRIDDLYWQVLGRPARATEIDRANRFLTATTARHGGDRRLAWRALAQVLIDANEFIYIP